MITSTLCQVSFLLFSISICFLITVINDLLDPTGQNLRVREDVQRIYVKGIKEEVVLSPEHVLSFIAAGEEQLELRKLKWEARVSTMRSCLLFFGYILKRSTRYTPKSKFVLFTGHSNREEVLTPGVVDKRRVTATDVFAVEWI